MAHDIHPSPAVLKAVASSLRLSAEDTRHLFTLSEQARGVPRAAAEAAVPVAVDWMVRHTEGSGILVYDRFLTALRWNRIGDALFDYSTCRDDVDRNVLFRLLTHGDKAAWMTTDADRVLRLAVGLFHRAYETAELTAVAHQVFESVRDLPEFKKLWSEHPVADHWSIEGLIRRKHPVAGDLRIMAMTLEVPSCPGLWIRQMSPADPETATKFAQLARLGAGSE